MTKREALEKSIEMWTWIRDNRAHSKWQYFVDKEDVKHNCYLCEYASERLGIAKLKFHNVYPTCAIRGVCPVKNWSTTSNVADDCLTAASPYKLYEYGKKFSYEIADDMLFILNRALNELEEEND